jgi:hypothetical protein
MMRWLAKFDCMLVMIVMLMLALRVGGRLHRAWE